MTDVPYMFNKFKELLFVLIAVFVGGCLTCVCMYDMYDCFNEDQHGNNIEVDTTPAVSTRIENTGD